jgi:hypothetical protein
MVIGLLLVGLGYNLRALTTQTSHQKMLIDNTQLKEKLRMLGNCYRGDVKAIAIPECSTVGSGEEYKAQLLLAIIPTDLTPEQATLNGRSVPVDAQGNGQIAFRAPTRLPRSPRPLKARWVGALQCTVNGRDTTFSVVVPYTVAGTRR